jgi:hypothetical protein
MSLVIVGTAHSMRGVGRTSDGRWLALGWFAALVIEYKRAITAEQYYHVLKRASPPTVVSSGIAVPRRIFEDLYSSLTAPLGRCQRQGSDAATEGYLAACVKGARECGQ